MRYTYSQVVKDMDELINSMKDGKSDDEKHRIQCVWDSYQEMIADREREEYNSGWVNGHDACCGEEY